MSEIRCRSQKSPNCYNGRDESTVYDPDLGQSDDGTWDGETVICDACYVAIGQPSIPIEQVTPERNPGKLEGGKGSPRLR